MADSNIRVDEVMGEIERDVRTRLRRHLIKRGGAADYQDEEIFEAVRAVLARAVDERNLDATMLPELLDQFRKTCPAGLPESRARLVALLTDAGKHFGLTADRFVLGGFSQGAMLSTDVALRLKNAPAGLCILSGALINDAELVTCDAHFFVRRLGEKSIKSFCSRFLDSSILLTFIYFINLFGEV